MKTEKTSDGLKFLHLAISNFKNISAREVDINGMSFAVVGKNATGKSSLIQALSGSVDGSNIPSKAIKEGEERGSIEVVLGGTVGGKEKKYTISTYFTPGKQSGRLVITNEIGEKIKGPSTFIRDLIGNVSFDVTSFLHATKAKKIEMLKTLTGCGVQIDLINVEITNKKAEKKVRKESMESLEGSVKNHGFTAAEVELFSDSVPIQPLQDEMAGISKSVENWTKMEQNKKNFEDSIPKAEADIVKADKEYVRFSEEIRRLKELLSLEEFKITELKENIKKSKENIIVCDNWFASRTKPDVDSLSKKITAATEHNEKHELLKKFGNQQKEINKIKNDILLDDTEIKKLEEKRNTVISNSQLGIKGLSFTESEIYVDNLPLEENQINTARLFDIGVDIEIAKNPNFKVIFLHDASLFDTEGLKSIIKKAEDKGFQVIAEIVSDDKDVEIKFTETDLK